MIDGIMETMSRSRRVENNLQLDPRLVRIPGTMKYTTVGDKES